MRMSPPKIFQFSLPTCLLAVVGLFFLHGAWAQTAHPQANPAWRPGLTRQDVITELGDPEGDLVNGATERMIYKGGMIATFTNGQLTGIEGMVPAALQPKPEPPPTPPAPKATAPAAMAASQTTPLAESGKVTASAPTPSTAVSAPTSAPAPSASPAMSQGDLDSEKIINDFSTTSIIPQGTTMSGVIAKALGPGPDGSGEASAGTGLPKGLAALVGSAAADTNKSPWATEGTWEWFVLGLVLKTLIMTGVLKGTFAYKEFPVLWREAAVVAFGVSVCNQGLAALFLLNDFGKIAAMVQADQLVAGAVLLGLIMNFTAAKQLPTAAGIMISAMTANIAVGYAQLFFL